MSLGKTFTRSIVREVGRNYGKAISNSLLGDKHSTPVRMVGNSNDVTRKRGNKYHNKLDELIQKLAIKGATATLNQGQNIYNAYFELVEEAQADGVIDLDELVFLVKNYTSTFQSLEKIEIALTEMSDSEKAKIINDKKEGLNDFLSQLNDALVINEDNNSILNQKTFVAFILNFLCLDRIYLFPKKWDSYFWLIYILFFGSTAVNSFNLNNSITDSINLLIGSTAIYWLIINPLRKKGVWEYIGDLKRSIKIKKASVDLKEIIQKLLA
jgi:hypothetical protein